MRAFKDWHFSKKLALGFGGMALLIALITLINYRQASVAAEVSTRVTQLRVPTANSSMQMLNGINHALAALRGWMLLGNEKFVDEREKAWEAEIWPAFQFMETAAANWTNPENVARFERIRELLPEFEKHQQDIEAIAQTRDNVQATNLLFTEAAPLAQVMVGRITQMIDLEAKEEATPERKALLGMMADVRGSTGLALANIRAFLLGGDEQYKQAFDKFWATNTRRFADLRNASHLMTDEQYAAFEAFSRARAEFAPLPPRMLDMRSAPDWNTGNHWLATRAAPIGAELATILKAMSQDQAQLLADDGQLVATELNTLKTVSWVALLIGVGLAAALGFVITGAITGPLQQALRAVRGVAGGRLDQDIQVSSRDEAGQLLQGVKDMQSRLKEVVEYDVQSIVDAAARGDLDRRISLDGKEGFYQGLSVGINELVDVNQRVVDETVAMLGAMSQGDLNRSITSEYQGTFDQLKLEANATVEKLSVVIEHDIQSIIDAARRGDLSQRIDLAGKQGFYEKLASGVNELVGVSEQVTDDTIRVFAAMAEGDLSQTIDASYTGSFDSLKRDANATVSKLTEVVTGIQRASGLVTTGAQEISQGNTNLSQRTEEQASSLEETAASMEQMTTTVKQNADNAVQANHEAIAAQEQAEAGGRIVRDAVQAMAEINSSSQKIADIIGVIDEIAFQTNLLALNASVEAARAGDQGRGFAVVASEVRNLAGRSATAAKEIKELIEDSVGKVEEGSRLVNASGERLEDIVQGVKKVTDIVGEIATASQEQSSGIEQVNKAIVQMDELTQQNAALVEEAAAASESMGEQARGLGQMMAFFSAGQAVQRDNSRALSVVAR